MEPLVIRGALKKEWDEPVDADDDEYEVRNTTCNLQH
jgi:hypothetical protein